jgi:hypothetical protein
VDRRLRVTFALLLVAMVPAVLYFTTEGTWDLLRKRESGGYSTEFFLAQARSMQNGRLDVSPEAIHSECWDRDNHCFGYFGVTPSVVRMPFLRLLVRRWHSAATPLFLGFALLLAYWSALRLLRRILSAEGAVGTGPVVLGYGFVAALALVPGGTLLFLARPAVYEEASAWAIAFFLLALDRVWAWHHSRRLGPLVAAVVLAVAAANARPTATTGCAVLGLTLAALGWRGGRRGRAPVLVAAACLVMLPTLTAAGVYWLKFQTPLPNLHLNEQVREAPHWAKILRTNGDRTAGLAFTPTELVAYFRPDAVAWSGGWPCFDFRFPAEPIRWVAPLPRDGAYVERVTSATTAMPLPWALTVVTLVGLAVVSKRLFARSKASASEASVAEKEGWVLAAGSLASALAMIALTVTTVGITNRYLGDFYPASVAGAALGHRVLVPVISRRPLFLVAAAVTSVLLVAWSVLVVFSLTTRLVFM